MINQKSLEELKNQISNSQKIAIFGHDYIDWDCIGATLGFWAVLEKLGKKVSYFTSYSIYKNLSWIEWIQKYNYNFDYKSYDIVFVLDFQRFDRLSKIDTGYFVWRKTFMIDHHPWDQDIEPTYKIIDTSASSACELIWEYVYELYSDLIDAKIANYFLIGTITDTWFFEYEKDSISTFRNTSQMIEKWADKKYILQKLKPSYDAVYFNFLKKFIDRINYEDGIVYSYILQSDTSEARVDKLDDLWYFRDYIRYYEWAELSIYISQKEKNVMSFSMRSTEWIAGPIARNFGGWWHPNAWSFNIILQDWQDVHELISQTISDIKTFYKTL